MGNVLIYLLVFIEAFCIEEKYIKYPFKTNFGGYYMELLIGNPAQKIYHGIDQGLTVTWTDYSMYSPDKSNTKHIIKDDTQLKFQNIRLYGKELSDDIIFPNENKKDIIMNSFPFFHIHKQPHLFRFHLKGWFVKQFLPVFPHPSDLPNHPP